MTASRRLQPFRYLHDCSDCFRLEQIAGWGLHPLESAAFARRTPKAASDAPLWKYAHSDNGQSSDSWLVRDVKFIWLSSFYGLPAAAEQPQEAVKDRVWMRRAARNVEIYREQTLDPVAYLLADRERARPIWRRRPPR